MFTREELLEKKKFEIQQIAKGFGITRYKRHTARTKEDLINDILAKQNGTETAEEKTIEEDEKQEDVPKIVSEVKKLEKRKLTEEQRIEKKKNYVENAQVGTLVAFRCDTGKVKSAMIIKRSTSKRRFLLETKYGAKFKVSFDDILWVRTNKRWPKGVFKLLRGETLMEQIGE